MINLDFTFTGDVWLYHASKASWHFVSVPEDISSDIKVFTKHLVRGFRSVKVTAKIGESLWQTSIFPDSETGCYFLPLKAAIRKAENIKEGVSITVQIIIET